MNPNPSKKGRLNFNKYKSPSSLPQPECVSMNQIMNAKRMRSQTKELPEEIVTEIQLRLPVKSLVRFRCVSKHWLSSTNDPKFIRLHINRLRDQHNHLYDCDNSTTISSYPQCSIILSFNCNGPFIPKIPVGSKIQCIGGGYREEAFQEALDFDFPLIQGQYFEIKACCDGLVCLFIGQATLVLWNPSIRQHRILPLPPYVVEDHAELEVFGLGYDSTIDDYKLVRLPTMPGFNLMESNVFNLKSNKWTRIPDLPCYIGIDQDLAISSHGGLYWIASVDSNIKDMILRFDLADETYRKIPLPPNKSTVQCNYRLGLWGGFICLLLDHAFWVMKGGGEQGWIKVMTIPKIPAPQDSVFSYLFEALCLTKSGKVVIVISRVKFFLYDPREQTVMELNIPGLQDGWFQETIYFESLVSPWGGNA